MTTQMPDKGSDSFQLRKSIQDRVETINEENLGQVLNSISSSILTSSEIVMDSGLLTTLQDRVSQLHGEENGEYQKIVSHASGVLATEKQKLIASLKPIVDRDDARAFETFLNQKKIRLMSTEEPSEIESMILDFVAESLEKRQPSDPFLVKICSFIIEKAAIPSKTGKFPKDKAEVVFNYLLKGKAQNQINSEEFFKLMLKLVKVSRGLEIYQTDRPFWTDLFAEQKELIQGNGGRVLLVQALKDDLKEIAQFLVDAGVNLNEPVITKDMYGREVSQHVCEALGFEPFLTIWLVRHGFELHKFDSAVAYFFGFNDNKNSHSWGTCLELLALNVPLPPDYQQKLITKALTVNSAGSGNLEVQIGVIDELLARTGKGKPIDLDKWKDLNPFWGHTPDVVTRVLTHLIAEGFDVINARTPQGETFLFKALDSYYLDVVHLLIKKAPELLNIQGGNKKTIEKLCLEKGINLEKLKRNLTKNQGIQTPVEIDFTDKTTMKVVCNLIGDQHLEGLLDLSGNRIEGGNPSQSMGYMAALCRMLVEYGEKYPDRMTSGVKERLIEFSEELERSIVLFSSLIAKFTKTVENVVEILAKVDAGERLLIPSGWIDPVMGHFMLFECSKLPSGNYQILLFNSGDGLQYHQSFIQQQKRYLNTMRAYEIPADEMTNGNLLKALLEPRRYMGDYSIGRGGARGAFDVYPLLERYSLPSSVSSSESDLSFWARKQESGTCSMSGILVCLGARLGRNAFREIKPLMEYLVLKKSLEKFEPMLQTNLPFRKVLTRVAPKMFQRIAKELSLTDDLSDKSLAEMKSLLSEMEGLMEEINDLSKSSHSQACSFSAPSGYKQIKIDNLGDLSWPDSLKKPEMKMDVDARLTKKQSSGIGSFEGIKSYEDLMAAIQGFNEEIATSPSSRSSAIRAAQLLTEFGRVLYTEPSPQWLLELRSELYKNQETLLLIMDTINRWGQQISSSSDLLQEGSLVLEIALSYALALSWEFAVAYDNLGNTPLEARLDFYGIPTAHVFQLVDGKNRLGFFGAESQPVLRDFATLRTVFTKIQKESKNDGERLWDVNHWKKITSDNAKGELKYYKAKLSTLDDEVKEKFANELKQALQEYNKEADKEKREMGSRARKKAIPYEAVNLEYWQRISLYQQDRTLLRHVAMLRYALLRSQLIAPIMTQKRDLKNRNFQTPLISPVFNHNSRDFIECEIRDFIDPLINQGKISREHSTQETKREVAMDFSQAIPKHIYFPQIEIFLNPTSQNHICFTGYANDYVSALLAASLETNLQFSLLIDYLENHMQELEDPLKQLMLFSSILRNPSVIGKMSEKQIDELNECFNDMIIFFEDRVNLKVRVDSSNKTLVFLHDLRMRFNLLREGETESVIAKARSELREFVKQSEINPSARSFQYKQALLDTLIHSYANKEQFTFEELLEIYSSYSWIIVHSNAVSFPLSYPQAVGERERVFQKGLSQLSKIIHENETQAKSFGNLLLQTLGIQAYAVGSVSSQGFPSITFELLKAAVEPTIASETAVEDKRGGQQNDLNGKGSSDQEETTTSLGAMRSNQSGDLSASTAVSSYNLMTGQFLLNGSPLYILDDAKVVQLREFFEDPATLVLTGNEGVYEGVDKISPFRLKFEKDNSVVVHRKFAFSTETPFNLDSHGQGRWYRSIIIPKDFYHLAANSPSREHYLREVEVLERTLKQEFPVDVEQNYQHWWLLTSEGDPRTPSEVKMVVLKKQTSECVYKMTGEQNFIFSGNDQRPSPLLVRGKIEDVFIAHNISRMHPIYEIWSAAESGSDYHLLRYPKLKSDSGHVIEFEWRNTAISKGEKAARWVWKENPHLFISEEQSFEGIEGLNRFIVLENSLGRQEVLIPIVSSEDQDRANISEQMTLLDKYGNKILLDWKMTKIGGDKYVSRWVIRQDPRFYFADINANEASFKSESEEIIRVALDSKLNKIHQLKISLKEGPQAGDLDPLLTNIKTPEGIAETFKWSYVPIDESTSDYRWVSDNKPAYYLKPEQNLRTVNENIVLELAPIYIPKVDRSDFHKPLEDLDIEVSIPKENLQAVVEKMAKGPKKTDQEIVTCQQIGLRGKSIASNYIEHNLFVAYLAFKRSVGPKDLNQVSKYLQNAFKYEKYSDEELKYLGLILIQSSIDFSPDSIALGIYACWLVKDNMNRNPQFQPDSEKIVLSNPPDFSMEASEWLNFWRGKIDWKQSPGSSQENTLGKLISKHFERYTENQNLVQHDLKLEQQLDQRELKDIGLFNYVIPGSPVEKVLPIFNGNLTSDELSVLKSTHSSGWKKVHVDRELSRPTEIMPAAFWDAYKDATSNDPLKREVVSDFIKYISDRTALLMILEIALISKNNPGEDPNSRNATLLVQEFNDLINDLKNANRQTEQRIKESLNKFTVKLALFLKQRHLDLLAPFHQHEPTQLPEKTRILFAKSPPTITLPLTPPPITPVGFKPLEGTDREFEELFNKYFVKQETPSKSDRFEPLVIETDDPLMKNGLDLLNEDYQVGRTKNLNVPRFVLKDEPVEGLIADIEVDILEDKAQLEKLRHDMLALARSPSKNRIVATSEAAELLALQKHEIDLDDLIALFHMECEEEYRKATHLTTTQEIHDLHLLIGSCLLLKNRVNRQNQILNYAKNYLQSENDGYLQLLGRELEKKRAIDFSSDPAAFLVLESALDLILREDQLDGLRTMLPQGKSSLSPPPKVLIQRIQGGGKTLVWGHTLALLKADGYHLSVHIPATPQYRTALYDMAHHSKKMFGQKERTIIFDDRPEHVSDGYLEMMHYTLIRAVSNREYVTIPKESLQAMRGKYIKMRKELNTLLLTGSSPKADEIISTINKLGAILKLLRQRAVFTIDEMHQGFNPRIELNLPTGPITHPSKLQNHLAADLLKFGMLAKSADGRLLLQLKENRQTEQTASDRELMLKEIKRSFLDSVRWMECLGVISKGVTNEKRKAKLASYIEGTGPFPRFLRPETGEAPSDAAQIAVLARKLIGEGWLTDRLKASVNEHQGITSDPSKPPISVPFTANMKEAEGSEFSDRTVMGIYTLIAYFQNGIPLRVLTEMIIRSQNEAIEIWQTDRANGRNSVLDEIDVCKKFREATGLNLFAIDTEVEEDIRQVQHALQAGKAETIDFIADYVINNVLASVELHDTQVSSNGQNLGSMALSFNGYSGTFDNLNLTPIGAVPHPDIGTDGQTVDLLVRQNDEIWVVDSTKEESVITQLIEKHPDGDKIQCLVDVGCHFRGTDNETAARLFVHRMLVDSSKLSGLEGVLFFNTSDQLCFINKSQPAKVITLSGTSKETIQTETNFPVTKLFTFFGNSNIEGFDIAMGDEIKAIVTIGEQNRKHQLFQGSRRLRKLQDMQRIVLAVKQGALSSMSLSVKNDKIAALPLGRADPKQFSVKELVLHLHLNSQNDQLPDNLTVATQKMEDFAQQMILDRLYDAPADDAVQLFRKVECLFDKQVAIDLYAQYAHGMDEIPTERYLTAFRDHLVAVMKTAFPRDEIALLVKTCNELVIAPMLSQLKSTVKVPASAESGSLTSQNNDQVSTQLQSGIAMQKQQVQRLQISEQQEMDQELFLEEWLQPATDHPLLPTQIVEGTFGNSVSEFSPGKASARSASCQLWSLNQMIKSVYPDKAVELSENVLITSDFACTIDGQVDLFTRFRKDAYQLLLIRDRDESKEGGGVNTKIVILSIKDADAVIKAIPMLSENQSTRELTLLRPNGKLIASTHHQMGEAAEDWRDKEVMSLLTQVNYFRGSTENLSKPPFFKVLKKWIPKEKREGYATFFDSVIFPSRRNPPPFHQTSAAGKFLSAEAGVHH